MNAGDSSKPTLADDGASWFRLILRRYPIGDADMKLLERLTIAIVLGAIFLAAFHRLDLVYSHKFFDVTGRAVWIWAPVDIAPKVQRDTTRRSGVAAALTDPFRFLGSNLREVGRLFPIRNGHFDRDFARETLRDLFTRDDRPMSRRDDPMAFFATRNFDLPANRYFTHLKVVADPEYTVWFNGREIGGRRVGEDSTLDVFDVTTLARTTNNRLVIAVRSTTASGGLIAAVDVSPEVQNYVVTDSSWKIVREYTPDLLQRDPPRPQSPVIIGAPPIGRWNYLEPVDRPLEPSPTIAIAPKTSFSFVTALPEIRDASGTTIVSSRPERATAFDFGEVDGRLRVTRLYNVHLPSVVNVRFANAPEELRPIEGVIRPFVFAPGEATILDSEVRHFRFASVYGRPATAVVMK